MSLFRCLVWSCFAVTGAMSSMAAPRYSIQGFGSDGYYNNGTAGGLNELGQIAYTNSFPHGSPGFDKPDESYFYDGAVGHNLPSLGGLEGQIYDINNHGTIVGSSASQETFTTEHGDALPVVYAVQYQNGQIEKLPVPSGFPSFANAINDRGQIIGTVVGFNTQQTFLLDPSQGYIDLGTFGGEFAYAPDLNNSGQVLVNSYYAGPVLYYGDYAYKGVRTLIYKDGQETPLPAAPSQITFGSAINDRGQVAGGFYSIPGQESHAFIWDAATGMTDISGGQNTTASDINNEGTVVGHRTISYPTETEAFVYTKATGMQNLIDLIPPDSGWTSLSYATSINDRGQILGVGTQGGNYPLTVFLLTPVPEPPSIILAIFACCIVRFLPRGNRKNAQPKRQHARYPTLRKCRRYLPLLAS